jgi:hypothetical protein
MRRAIGAALVVLLVGCSGGGDSSTSVADDVGARQAALPTTTTQATTTVASASQLLEVPDLVGRTVDYAEGALATVGLVLVVETRANADSDSGVIFEQLPEAGGQATSGSPVVVRIPATTTTAPTPTPTPTPTTTTVSTTTAAPTTTTTAVPAVVIDEEDVLTFAYEWGPSAEAAALQTLLGLTADGWYGPGTQSAHIAELEARGLPTNNVPNKPSPTTTAAVETTTTLPPTTETPTTTTEAIETTTTVALAAPGQVRELSVTPGDGQLSATWLPPSDGGAPASYWFLWANNNDWTNGAWINDAWNEVELSDTNHLVTGLTNGTRYTVEVFVYNSAGWSEGVTTEYAVVPLAPTTTAAPTTTQAADAPSAPQNLWASSMYLTTGGLYAVDLLWDAPASNGGSALIQYQVGVLAFLDDETSWIPTEGTETSMTVTGLNSTDNYTIGVFGVNAVGYGEYDLFPTVASYSSSGGSSGGSGSNAGWFDCYFNGVPIWGTVHVADYSWEADFTVYVADYSWSADLSVHPADYSWEASSCGMWATADYSWEADFSVYFVDYSWEADFSIHFVDYSWEAGR